MAFNKDVIEAIGNTPLIKLKRASELTGCTILGKAEFMNPGQSVKDRAGKWMILEAEKRGELKPAGSWWNRPRAIPASASPSSPAPAVTGP
jgi:cysteine synthase A